MESIFTLPYSKYKVAEELQKKLPKKDGYSVLIPISRQQKGFDLMLFNYKTSKHITIQIKASRS